MASMASRGGGQGWFTAARRSALSEQLPCAIPAAIAVALMLLWAEHDGGYDQDTWYWGALVLLAVLAVCLAARIARPVPRITAWAMALLALYVAWSYASIAWAQAPGTALDGSNRALLYLIVFSLFAVLPWTAKGALAMLGAYAIGVGVIALVTMLRLAAASHLDEIFLEGRLIAPTGYFNSSVALFTSGALVATALSLRRELAAPLRGMLIACACVEMQLALMGQSRGWLLTLPFVLIIALVLIRERIRFAIAGLLPIVSTLVPIHPLLDVYNGAGTPGFQLTAQRAGRAGLLAFAMVLLLGTWIAWFERSRPPLRVSARAARATGAILAIVAVAGATAGVAAATHGQPVAFVKRQLNGFTHEDAGGTSSNFATVGSGRYDFWRVALQAFLSDPIGGLGQDNFANYYVVHRRTYEEPAWPHSLEMRLLACTGIVGFLLFAGFLISALRGALRAARGRDPTSPPGASPPAQSPLQPAVCAAALLPLFVWLLHGSVDWFWEMPALSAPALGFLAMALGMYRAAPGAAATPPGAADIARYAPASPRRRRARAPAWLVVASGILALSAAAVVLGFPYLSVREVSDASDAQARNPAKALDDLRLAAALDPLSAVPGQLAGRIALTNGLFNVSQQRYQQAISRDSGSWMSWLGLGLADSALGDSRSAAHALGVAASINRQQPVIGVALARVNTTHPLAPLEALSMITPP